jgi:hypothetical protein
VHPAELGDPGRVIEEVPQRDLVAPRLEVRQPLRDVVVQREFPLVTRLQNRRSGELLGVGIQLEHGVHRRRRVTLEHGFAVRLEEKRVVPLDDGGHDADCAILADAGAGNGVQSLHEVSPGLGGRIRGTNPDEHEQPVKDGASCGSVQTPRSSENCFIRVAFLMTEPD